MLHTLLLSLALGATLPEFEAGGVRVELEVQAQLFHWTITNVDAPPITSFAVDHATTYPAIVPDGWQIDDQRHHLRTWTDDADLAIQRGESMAIRLRTTSSGSVLGTVPLQIGLEGVTEPVVFENAWAPVQRPRSIPMIVPATLVIIGLLHAGILSRLTQPLRAKESVD